MFKRFLFFIIPALFIMTGCSNNTDIIKSFKKKINKLEGYKVEGVLEISNNETTYKYDVNVAYEKEEKYRVSLKNKVNDHEQIILKNSDGVYLLTPALNKSFKFQSEWPYSNSQSYLYQNIINDIENDDNVKVEEKDKEYIIKTKVNYLNNKDLVNQKIYLDKNLNIKKVEVLNKDGIVKIKMTYNKVNNNPKFAKDYFKLSNNIEVKENDVSKDEKNVSKMIDIAYPLYIPNNTKLTNQDTIKGENGDRTILTFAGDSAFTIIEEAVEVTNDNQTLAVNGELGFINGVLGNISDNSVSWITDGVEYYATSNSMDTYELLEVVNSINTIAIGK